MLLQEVWIRRSCCSRNSGSDPCIATETPDQIAVLLQTLWIRALYCYRNSGSEGCIATETLDQSVVLRQKIRYASSALLQKIRNRRKLLKAIYIIL